MIDSYEIVKWYRSPSHLHQHATKSTFWCLVSLRCPSRNQCRHVIFEKNFSFYLEAFLFHITSKEKCGEYLHTSEIKNNTQESRWQLIQKRSGFDSPLNRGRGSHCEWLSSAYKGMIGSFFYYIMDPRDDGQAAGGAQRTVTLRLVPNCLFVTANFMCILS